MSRSKSKPSLSRRPLAAVLHSVLVKQGAAIPQTVEEVAGAMARQTVGSVEPVPPPPGPPLFSWERRALTPDNLLAFRTPPVEAPLAFAARTSAKVSPETQAKLRDLIREMEAREKPPYA